jgi:hypothetical protein
MHECKAVQSRRDCDRGPLRRRLLVLATLGLALAATVVQGWQGTGAPPTDLRALTPSEQRQWVESRLQALEKEQTQLRQMLATLDAGQTLEAPYPLAPGWPVPDQERFTPRDWQPVEDMRPVRTRESAPRKWSDLSDAEQSAYSEMALEMAPEMRGELKELRENEPEQYEELMQRNLARLLDMMHLRDRDQEVFRLRQRDSELSRFTTRQAAKIEELRDAGDLAQAGELEDLLREKIAEHFGVRQELRAQELDRLAVRLRDLEEEHAVRSERQEDLVEARMDELLDRFAKDVDGE